MEGIRKKLKTIKDKFRKNHEKRLGILRNFNRFMKFFLNNYERRIKLYENPEKNISQIKFINKGERKVVDIIKNNVSNLEGEALTGNPNLSGMVDKLNENLEVALDQLQIFLDLEKDYVDGKITSKELKESIENYNRLKSSISIGELKSEINSLNVNTSLKKKILSYIRNNFIFPAFFVEIFGLIYNSYNAYMNDTEFTHTSAGDFLLFYLIVIIVLTTKSVDFFMKIYDVTISKTVDKN